MQDKESNGSSKQLVEIVARAIANDAEGTAVYWRGWTPRARAVLTAIKEAGYAVVPREPTEAMSLAGYRALSEMKGLEHAYRAMITAGEE